MYLHVIAPPHTPPHLSSGDPWAYIYIYVYNMQIYIYIKLIILYCIIYHIRFAYICHIFPGVQLFYLFGGRFFDLNMMPKSSSAAVKCPCIWYMAEIGYPLCGTKKWRIKPRPETSRPNYSWHLTSALALRLPMCAGFSSFKDWIPIILADRLPPWRHLRTSKNPTQANSTRLAWAVLKTHCRPFTQDLPSWIVIIW